MQNFLEKLANNLDWLIGGKGFDVFVNFILTLTVGAHLPQLYKVLKAPSVEIISLEMYLLLVVISFTVTLYGIKQNDAKLFLTMAGSFIVYCLILGVTLYKGGTFIVS